MNVHFKREGQSCTFPGSGSAATYVEVNLLLGFVGVSKKLIGASIRDSPSSERS